MRIGSLFSGAGGLDMAVEQVFGATTAWHCEVDPAASKVLAHRWPGVPNLGDITKVDWSNWKPLLEVDILCGGWPCQPWSSAGKKRGTSDERALWPDVARAVRELRPSIVVLENVADIVIRGELARAIGDLAALGYDAQWTCLRASAVGAPHRRERVFIVATDTRRHRHEQHPQLHRLEIEARTARRTHRNDVDGLALADLRLLPTPRTTDRFGAGRHGEGGLDLRTAVAERAGTTEWRQYEPAIHKWERLTRTAPAPIDQVPTKVDGNPRINPQFSEWLMGWPAGWVTDVPGISRNDALRIVGNGVCPQQATAALTWLFKVSEIAA